MDRTPVEPPTIADLRRTVAEILDLPAEHVDVDANLVPLGLGSLDMMRLITRWRRHGAQVSLSDLIATPTLESWHRHLLAAWPAVGSDVVERIAR